jgi:hypothetical protein
MANSWLCTCAAHVEKLRDDAPDRRWLQQQNYLKNAAGAEDAQ